MKESLVVCLFSRLTHRCFIFLSSTPLLRLNTIRAILLLALIPTSLPHMNLTFHILVLKACTGDHWDTQMNLFFQSFHRRNKGNGITMESTRNFWRRSTLLGLLSHLWIH